MTNDYYNDDGDGNAGCDGKSPIEEILGRVPRYKFVTELKNLGEIIFFCREIESVARSSEFLVLIIVVKTIINFLSLLLY